MSEWKVSKKWNPFNSFKLLAHVNTWKNIKRGENIPPPILVTVDPSNVCNLKCSWCNAESIISNRHEFLSKKCLMNIADYLAEWGVQAVCVAGGGEPLTNPHVGVFIERLVNNGLEVGVVTNGMLIDKYIESLSKCVWVGISIDAANNETYSKYKGVSKESQIFDKVINNMETLIKYSKVNNTTLGLPRPSYGVSYKFLLYKDNINDIFQAAKIAKKIGCKNIHYRPAGTVWDKLKTNQEISFTEDNIKIFNKQIIKAQYLDDETFGVYGITHKFNKSFTKCNDFNSCHAIFMTAVFEPPTKNDDKDSFIIGLCCDRRGDESLELLNNCIDVNEINDVWGSEKHWDIFDKIKIDTCPRCTYQPHNEIYEHVILNDSMTHKFI